MAVPRRLPILALAASLVTLLPAPGAAQASREGPSFGVSGSWGGAVRRPDAAYDPVNGVYLVVSGNLVHGRFVTPDGAPSARSSTCRRQLTHNQTARVAYSPQSRGASSSHGSTPGQSERVTDVGTARAVRCRWRTGIRRAVTSRLASPRRGWQRRTGDRHRVRHRQPALPRGLSPIGPPANDVVGQLVANAGGLVGGPSRSTPTITRRPSRASPTTRRPTSSWWRPATTTSRRDLVPSGGRSIAASSGGLGPVHEVAVGVACYVPQMEYNPSTNQFLVAWYQQPHIYGRLLGADGAPAGNVTAADLQLQLRRAGPSLQPAERDVFRGGARPAARRRRRADLERRRPRRRVRRHGDRRDATATSIRASSRTTHARSGWSSRPATSARSSGSASARSTPAAAAARRRRRRLRRRRHRRLTCPPPSAPNGSWFLAEGAESGTLDRLPHLLSDRQRKRRTPSTSARTSRRTMDGW